MGPFAKNYIVRGFGLSMARTKSICIALLMLTSILTGCIGTDEPDVETNPQIEDPTELSKWTAHYAVDLSDLPACNTDSIGLLYYVADINAFQTCQTNGWNLIDITGTNGLDGVNGSNGIDGVDGQNGQNGTDGVDGISTLVHTNPESAGSICTEGGIRLDIGADNDRDGTLSQVEIITTSYICHGQSGQSGAMPQLITTQSTPSLVECSEGGSIISTGLDDGSGAGIAMNGVLEENEISQSTTICQNLFFSPVKEFGFGSDDGIHPSSRVIQDNGFLYFTVGGTSAQSSRSIWRTDGTTSGTSFVVGGLSIGNCKKIGDLLFYGKDGPALYNTLYVYNLSSNQERVLKESSGGIALQSSWHGTLGNLFVFYGLESTNPDTLFVSDGTDSGTLSISDIQLQPAQDYAVLGNMLYFIGEESGSYELYKTDGTAAGVSQVSNINPSGNANVRSLSVIGNEIWFSADDGTNGQELWKTDGTISGTSMVSNIKPGGSGSAPDGMVSFNGNVYFSATHTTTGNELWMSDGTSAGTSLVKDIYPGNYPNDSYPLSLVVINGLLFFGANDGVSGYELWSSDGTNTGTILHHEFGLGMYGGYIREITELNGKTCLLVENVETGLELYCEQIITTFDFN
jgi:ELWxxDGT repeat protein